MREIRGIRVQDNSLATDLLESPCTYLLRENRKEMWICLPNGVPAHIQVALGEPQGNRVWGFTENMDGTISLTPSLLLHADERAGIPGWHGFLKHGVFQELDN